MCVLQNDFALQMTFATDEIQRMETGEVSKETASQRDHLHVIGVQIEQTPDSGKIFWVLTESRLGPPGHLPKGSWSPIMMKVCLRVAPKRYLEGETTDIELDSVPFHNYTQKCPVCFESKRFREFQQLNTSLKQINSFMQHLLGSSKAGLQRFRRSWKIGPFSIWRRDFRSWRPRSFGLEIFFIGCSKDGTMISRLSKLGGRKRGVGSFALSVQ